MDEKLLNKYIAGDALPEEKQQVVRWMRESEEHREQLTQLRRIYDATIWSENVNIQQVERKSVMKYIWRTLQVAAMLAMAVFILHKEYTDYKLEQSVEMQTLIVPEGQRACLALADGTKVWLNSNSTLRYPVSGFHAKERKVELDGEGYFEVAPDKEHPFIVQTEKYDVHVLGTTFNVYAYRKSGMFETSLIEGKVSVYRPGSQVSVMLEPNEKVTEENGSLYKTSISSDNQFLWRNGVYTFNDETLETIFKKLSVYYEVEIICLNKNITSRKCTGKFRQKEGIEQVMRVLQKYVRFAYKHDEEKNQIIIN